MTFEEWKRIVKGLKSVYTRDTYLPDADSVKIFYSLLKDLPYDLLSVTVQKWMMVNRFPPTVAELRGAAAEISGGKIVDWGYGWEQVLRAIRRFGYTGQKEALESMDEITRETVRRLGYQELCISENIATDRANFRMVYEQVARRYEEDDKVAESVKMWLTEHANGMLEGGKQ